MIDDGMTEMFNNILAALHEAYPDQAIDPAQLDHHVKQLLEREARLRTSLEQIKALAQTGVRNGFDQQVAIALEARKALGIDYFTPSYLE